MTILALVMVIDRTTIRFDELIFDFLVRSDQRPPDELILLVTIDDESLDRFGPWPWPRELVARLIETLQSDSPKVIAFDALFLEPAPGDERMAAAMASNAPTLLPLAIEVPGRNGRAFEIREPSPVLKRAAAGTGHVNLEAGDDGVVRRVRLWDGDPQRPVPQMMLRLSQMLKAGSSVPPSFEPRLIPFAGPAGHFRSISAAAILDGELPAEFIDNHIVMIGATATGLNDWHPVPVRGTRGIMSGVELQANLLDAILNERLIDEAALPERAIFAVLPMWVLMWGLRRWSPRILFLVIASLVMGTSGVSVVAFAYCRIWISPVTPLFVPLLAYVLWGWRRLATVHRYLTEEIDRLNRDIPDTGSTTRDAKPPDETTRQLLLLRNAINMLRLAQRQREHILQFLTHDMRAPQSLILSVVRKASGDQIAPAIASRIEGYACRTLELADNFVNLARAESEAYRFGPVDLSDVMTEAIDHLHPLAQEKRLRITFSPPIGEHTLWGDHGMLFRTMVNILLNAIRFSPADGQITCGLSHRLMDGRPELICTIADEGPGVAAERRAELFRSFATLNTLQNPQLQGVGLGLAFAETVVKRHGGKIWYEHGPGARFLIALPGGYPAQRVLR